jgi:hypothetical protein
MKKKLVTRCEFVAVGTKGLGRMTIVLKTVGAEESFEEIFAKVTHVLAYAANTGGHIA